MWTGYIYMYIMRNITGSTLVESLEWLCRGHFSRDLVFEHPISVFFCNAYFQTNRDTCENGNATKSMRVSFGWRETMAIVILCSCSGSFTNGTQVQWWYSTGCAIKHTGCTFGGNTLRLQHMLCQTNSALNIYAQCHGVSWRRSWPVW